MGWLHAAVERWEAILGLGLGVWYLARVLRAGLADWGGREARKLGEIVARQDRELERCRLELPQLVTTAAERVHSAELATLRHSIAAERQRLSLIRNTIKTEEHEQQEATSG
jgi:hypothetical protein